jgi:hypothetical protein
MALATGGQAVNAGAGRVGLAARLDRLAARQVQLGKLRGFERINVARQLITVAWTTVTVGIAVAALAALAWPALALALAFRTRTACLLRTVLARTLAIAMPTRGLAAVA